MDERSRRGRLPGVDLRRAEPVVVLILLGCALAGGGCQRDSSGDVPASAVNGPSARAGARPVTQPIEATQTEVAPVDGKANGQEPEELAGPNGNGGAEGTRAGGAAPNIETLEITFEDINLHLQPDIVFRPWMLTDRARELDGRRVRISGYMLPDIQQNHIRQFVLLRNRECKFGPGGQADHLINVNLVEGITTSYRDQPVVVEGVLKIQPFQGPDGNTWSIYDMLGDKVDGLR